MQKDFDRWSAKKTKLNHAASTLSFKEREIWFCYLGLNIGHEQDGDAKKFLRPVIILKKFSDEMFFGIPLTRTPRFGKEYFTIINDHGVGFAMLSQARAFDARRLKYYSAVMPEDAFESLKLRFLLDIL
jgi:mRNA interferase MazF